MLCTTRSEQVTCVLCEFRCGTRASTRAFILDSCYGKGDVFTLGDSHGDSTASPVAVHSDQCESLSSVSISLETPTLMAHIGCRSIKIKSVLTFTQRSDLANPIKSVTHSHVMLRDMNHVTCLLRGVQKGHVSSQSAVVARSARWAPRTSHQPPLRKTQRAEHGRGLACQLRTGVTGRAQPQGKREEGLDAVCPPAGGVGQVCRESNSLEVGTRSGYRLHDRCTAVAHNHKQS